MTVHLAPRRVSSGVGWLGWTGWGTRMLEATVKFLAAVTATFLISLTPVSSRADADAQVSPAFDFRGSWLVHIGGDVRIRVLIIADPPDEAGVTTAVYGPSDNVRQQAPVQVKLDQVGGQRRIRLLTQGGSVIEATEGSGGIFTGTITPRTGTGRGVTISRATDAELAASKRTLADPVPVGSDVPQECAAFQGFWVGAWTRGHEQLSINIPEISSDGKGSCIFRVGMASSATPSMARMQLNARPGESPSFPCGTGQICAFKVVVGDMWFSVTGVASYDMSDNRAVLHKMTR